MRMYADENMTHKNNRLFWYKRSKRFYIQFCSLKSIMICVFVVCVLSCAVGANLCDGAAQNKFFFVWSIKCFLNVSVKSFLNVSVVP